MDHFKGIKKIAVFRALKLGDMLCAIPAIRALRENFPKAKITLIGLPWAREIVERFGNYIDDFLEFPGYPGLPEQRPWTTKLIEFLKIVRDEKFDMVLQMHGSGILTNPLAMLFGGRQTFGFYLPGQFRPNLRTFFPYPAKEREVNRNIMLLEKIGLTSRGTQLEFPILTKDLATAGKLYADFGLKPKEFICIHPGSVSAEPWNLSKFARVADNFSNWGYKPVLTGIESERKITQKVSEQMKSPAVDLSGQTNLGTLAAIVKDSCFLVSNDTGVSHLADALSVPSVIIFVNSSQRRWASADRLLHRPVMSGKGDLEQVLNGAGDLKLNYEKT